MQLIGVALLLISIGTIVGPIGAVVVMYRDNLPQLIIPQQINDLMNGAGIVLPTGDNFSSENFTSEQTQFLAPVFVGAEVDNISRTFSVTVNFTNTFSFNLTLNQLTADIGCAEHNFTLGDVTVKEPISLVSGETTQIIVSGAWTADAENHFNALHAEATSINVNLLNLAIDVNGIVIQETGPINVGDISLMQ